MAGSNKLDVDKDGASSAWGCAAGERKAGLLNRVVDRFMNSEVVTSFAVATGVAATTVGLALAASASVAAYDANVGASYAPIHIGAMAQGVARPDYGYSNLTIQAIHHSKEDQRSVHAAKDSDPSRGAQVLNAMFSEIRLVATNPIVAIVHDPFVDDGHGGSKLDLDGILKVAPLMAKAGVKVVVFPFGVSDSADGRAMAKIMKDNGIAVFAPPTDKGVQAASGIVTVNGTMSTAMRAPVANLEVWGHPMSSIGKVAAHGAIYAAVNPQLKGSASIGSEIQKRIEQGTQIVVRSGASATTRRVISVEAVPGIRVPALVSQKSVSAAPAMNHAAHAAAMSADRGG